MSLVELSQEIDKLAKVIIQKNQELDNLKKGYNERLKAINSFISTLHLDQTDERITSDEFAREIGKEISCPNCNHTIYNGEADDFILIPKRQVEYLSSGGDVAKPAAEPAPLPQMKLSQKSKRKAHITCSFCREQGHTRANCKKRLGTTN
ncbi:hypothetical protein KGF57_005128 [Candida theae]|uniref:CCHC-type domain-containing protein n=1 Tax=Candida theae TaxID=1198502 RepID=A0AAD5BA83_9ASCO|nr:uncharacterized protein KGF57_005128 [Candida theae]KAI5948935.1 hypothetical protein KGF57_005128 [Candida theae]